MGAVRTAELLRSLEILGVTEHRFLDGPVDVDMDAHLDEAGAAQVLAIVEEVQPDTILTFGPDGMTGHQAHMDVCRWATEAFEAAAKPGARLYYATQTPEFVAEVVPQVEQFNIFRPGHPAGDAARASWRIDFVAEGEVLDSEDRLARGAREPDRGPPRGLRRGGSQPVPPRRVVPRRRSEGGVDGRGLEADASRRSRRSGTSRRSAPTTRCGRRCAARRRATSCSATRTNARRRPTSTRSSAGAQPTGKDHYAYTQDLPRGDDRDRGRAADRFGTAVRRRRHPHDERELRGTRRSRCARSWTSATR